MLSGDAIGGDVYIEGWLARRKWWPRLRRWFEVDEGRGGIRRATIWGGPSRGRRCSARLANAVQLTDACYERVTRRRRGLDWAILDDPVLQVDQRSLTGETGRRRRR